MLPAKWPLAALLPAAVTALARAAVPALADDPPRRYQDTVSAERVVVDVHAIDNAGEPVLGLSAGDFTLRVDGKPVPIESVEWIAGSSSSPAAPAPQAAAETAPESAPAAPAPGRVIVLFFQTDYDFTRITGQMRMIRQALAFLETCSPEDRLAVLSFDSRLKLRQDFTTDREKLRHAIVRTLYTDRTIDPRRARSLRSRPRSISPRPVTPPSRSTRSASSARGSERFPVRSPCSISAGASAISIP